jgi:D-alanine-D-alanine ligase
MKIRVGVIFGGNTVEHEVSVISAVQAMKHLNQDKYEIVPIYMSKDYGWYTGKLLMDISTYKDMDLLKRYAKKVVLINKNGFFHLQSVKGLFHKSVDEIDIALPIVHGNGVEDGTLQGYLEMIGIPYVGSHVLGSALGQDKVVMKQIMASANIPVVEYTWFYDSEYFDNKQDILKEISKLGYPVIVKPASLGSSVGIELVKKEEEIDSAIIDAIKYDRKIVVEKAVQNLMEVNCSVLGNYEYREASVIEEVMGSDEFLSYRDKYIGKSKGSSTKGMVATNRIIPARIDPSTKHQVEHLAKEVFRVLNFSGVCRVDFLIDKMTNKVYVNEPNTIPGSLSFYLWEPTGKKYPELLDELLTIAIKDYKVRSKKTRSFDTNILSNYNGLKGSKGKLK